MLLLTKARTIVMKKLHSFTLTFLALLTLAISTPAADIVFVSFHTNDVMPSAAATAAGFTNAPDALYTRLLRDNGHNVTRILTTDNAALDANMLNAADLVIISRSVNSAHYQSDAETAFWHGITAPVMILGGYTIRGGTSGNVRLGFMTGNTIPDTSTNHLIRLTVNDPTHEIFAGIALDGANTMVNPYAHPTNHGNTFQRGISVVTGTTFGGGVILATVGTPGDPAFGGMVIGEWQAGAPMNTTPNGGTNDILAGHRLVFLTGTREHNGAPTTEMAGIYDLESDGAQLFLNAVDYMIPGNPTDPVGFRTQPASITVNESSIGSASFSVIATGAPPRTIQWERSDGSGGFTNIPGATASTYRLSPVRATDDGAMFRATVANSFSTATSDIATLTVTADNTPASVLFARGTESFTEVYVRFSEAVDGGAADPANYQLDGGVSVTSVTLLNGGTNALLIVGTPLAEATVYNLTVGNIRDTAVSSNALATVTVPFTTFCTQNGYARREVYTGLTGTAISTLLSSPAFYNFSPASVHVHNTPETPVDVLNNFGTRMSGYLIPPVTGDYIFYICSDDSSQLFLSTDGEPRNAVLVAQETTWNPARTWTGDRINGTRGTPPVNISAPIALVAGQRYYFQVYHKEGGGGDNLGFTWQAPGDPIPVNGSPSAITGVHLANVSPCATVTITQHPANQTVVENRTVTFTVAATASAANLVLSYQWRKDGIDIPGATGSSYSIALAQMSDAGSYDVVITVAAGSATSDPAVLTVDADTEPPFIVSVGSLNGLTIGVCFNELVETNELTPTTDTFSYQINDGTDLTVTNVAVRPDRKSVILTLESASGFGLPMSGEFYVTTTSIRDLKGNGELNVSSATNVVRGFSTANLGTPLASGHNFACDANTIELVGGGTDIWGAADQGYWTYRPVSGDFDARVLLESLSLPAATGPATIAKGGLIVRQTADPNSPTLHLFANPLPPGRNLLEAGRRTTVGGNTSSWGTNQPNFNAPQWLRLTRTGNAFAGYRSTNGTDWIIFATTTQTLPSTLQLGLAVTAHTNSTSLVSTGRFSNFTVAQPLADVSITMTDAPDPVAVGSNLTYSITVNNAGPDSADGVLVTDPLPTGVTFVSATSSQGACANAAGTVTCTVGTMASGASVNITIVVRPTAAGTLNNTATVGSGAVDGDAANNSASVSTVVPARPRLASLTYSGTSGFGASFDTESGLTYFVEYKNNLNDPTWTLLDTIAGDGTTRTINDPEVRAHRFYRVRIE